MTTMLSGDLRLMLTMVMALAPAAAALADIPAKTSTSGDPGATALDRPGGFDSGGDDWGRYEMTASDPVTPLARIGAHHATYWDANPASPKVIFDISAYANEWDIAETGLEIKADYVPGYYISARVCARSAGNVGGTDGSVDTLEITGASTSPETTFGTFDPTGSGTCKTVNVYYPAESGADVYTLMVRPQLQIVQGYWQYTIYGKVIVEYHPILH